MNDSLRNRAPCRKCRIRERSGGRDYHLSRYCLPCQASLRSRERRIPVKDIGSGILSIQEIEVFALAYLSSTDIAEELGMQRARVIALLNNIRVKFAARTIAEALLIGMDEGYEVKRDV